MDEQWECIRRCLSALGSDVSGVTADKTADLFAPLISTGLSADVRLEANLAYGNDPAHRLDVYSPLASVGNRPALVFVHGGGYTGGDKAGREPFYRNLGVWAARQGLVVFIINYRLAPANRWPAAADDVRLAMDWVIENGSRFDLNAAKIILFGHSAGATHAASYLARSSERGQQLRPAAAILFSGLYEIGSEELKGGRAAYFIDDPNRFAEQSSRIALAGAQLPMLLAAAECEPATNIMQTTRLAERVGATSATRRCVSLVPAEGHNHFSTVLHLGAVESPLSLLTARFIAGVLEADRVNLQPTAANHPAWPPGLANRTETFLQADPPSAVRLSRTSGLAKCRPPSS